MLLLKKNYPFIIILFALSIISTIKTIAQGNVGIGTGTPNASALLDVSATNKGLLIPRMTSAQMNAIASPATGLLIYNTDSAAFAYRTGAGWIYLKGNSTASNDWSTMGNAGIDTAANFIGTTDDNDIVFKWNNIIAGRINGAQTNTSFGTMALSMFQPDSRRNTAIGSFALQYNADGVENTALGTGSLRYNSRGSYNTAIGVEAGYYASTGNSNTSVGKGSLFNNFSGDSNTALGYSAGSVNATGSGNVYIGYSAGSDETNLSNKLYIDNARSGSQSLIYGEFDNKLLSIGGKLGIGLLPAGFPLEIKSQSVNGDLVKFYNDTNIPKWHLKLLNNGAFNFTETNVADYRLVLNPGGEVGIGKITGTSNNDSRLQIKQKGSQNGLGIEAAGYSNHWDFYVTEASNSTLAYYYNGVIKGNFSPIDGAYVMASDRGYKKDIVPQTEALQDILQLQPMRYHYTDNSPADKLSIGFIAQDVQKIFPDAVREMLQKDGTTGLGINYQYFTVLAIKGLQEQQQEIERLKQQMQQMTEAFKKLQQR